MNHSTEWNPVQVKWQGRWEPAKAITPTRVEVVCSERAAATPRLKMGTYVYVYSPGWGFRWIAVTQIKWKEEIPQIVLTPPETEYAPPAPKTPPTTSPKAKKQPPAPKTQEEVVEVNRKTLQKAHRHLDRKQYNRAAQLYVKVLNNTPDSIQQVFCNICLKECEAALKPKDWRQVFANATHP